MAKKATQVSSLKKAKSVRPSASFGESASLLVDRGPSRLRIETTLRRLINQYHTGMGDAVDIRFTENASTMISRSERNGNVRLRLHCLFLNAPDGLLSDLVRYFFSNPNRRTKSQLRSRLVDFVAEHRHLMLSSYPLNRMLPPRGQVYNLEEIRAKLVREYFPALETVPNMGWTRRRHRTLMGKWLEIRHPAPNLILINRLLDDVRVPTYYLAYVVFHELLHELTPIERCRGRWIHHPPEFRQRERLYRLYRLAQQWEEEALPKLAEVT